MIKSLCAKDNFVIMIDLLLFCYSIERLNPSDAEATFVQKTEHNHF